MRLRTAPVKTEPPLGHAPVSSSRVSAAMGPRLGGGIEGDLPGRIGLGDDRRDGRPFLDRHLRPLDAAGQGRLHHRPEQGDIRAEGPIHCLDHHARVAGDGEPLFERLIDWRRQRARADGVPAYVVADNKTLAAIAARRPEDEVALLAVPGIGQRKVSAYGAEILQLVAKP
jgi:superfamily II DNA helicase RecQ